MKIAPIWLAGLGLSHYNYRCNNDASIGIGTAYARPEKKKTSLSTNY